jgi:hypothetical protein
MLRAALLPVVWSCEVVLRTIRWILATRLTPLRKNDRRRRLTLLRKNDRRRRLTPLRENDRERSARPGVKVQGVAPLSWRVYAAAARRHGLKNEI